MLESFGRVKRVYAHHPHPSPYDAGSTSRVLLGWNPPETTANNGLIGNLRTQRKRSRHSIRNDGYAKGTNDALVRSMIGTGIKPLSQVPDDVIVAHPLTGKRVPLRDVIHWRFDQWTDECDADGLCDFYGLEGLATHEWLDSGTAFVRRRPRYASDGLSVPLQLQVIEPESLAQELYIMTTSTGNRVRSGIEFNAIGQRVAYYFYPERPDLDYLNLGMYTRVPADSVIQMFDPLRAGQMLGVPRLSAALVKFSIIDKTNDAILRREHIANLFAGFVTTTDDVGVNPVERALGRKATPQTEGQSSVLSMQSGTMQALRAGEKIEFADPPKPPDTYEAFMRHQLRGACAATGVPYEIVTGDMSGLNDRLMRVLLVEFRRGIMAEQHQIIGFQLCRRVWSWWFDAAIVSRRLPIAAADYRKTPELYNAVKWMPQGWEYINPVQDIEAAKEGIRIGVSSRQSEAAARGEDAEIIDQQNAADNRRADALGLRYDSDGRQAATPKTSITTADDTTPAAPAA